MITFGIVFSSFFIYSDSVGLKEFAWLTFAAQLPYVFFILLGVKVKPGFRQAIARTSVFIISLSFCSLLVWVNGSLFPSTDPVSFIEASLATILNLVYCLPFFCVALVFALRSSA